MKKIKKITEKEVYDALVDYPSVEIDGLGEYKDDVKALYYLHMKEDGTIVDNTVDADVDFIEFIWYDAYAETVDEFREIDLYDYERPDFEPFMHVVRDLTSDANEWLEHHEKEEDDD